MATYTGVKKIKIGNNIFELAVDWSNVANPPTIPTNTDEKLKTVALTSGTTYYPILATGANAAANRQVDSTLTGLKYVSSAGSTSAVGTATLYLGNGTASGTANNEQGVIRLYGTTAYYTDIKAESGLPAANRTIYVPSYAGTMYLTCTSTTDAVGGATSAPVYVDNTGRIQAVTSIPYSLLTGTPTIPTIPSNNVTGSGTNGYLTKWNGTYTVTNGPQLGSSTTTYLRNDGSWATPPGTYSLPLAANGTRGGIQIGYSSSGKNYAVQLSSEKAYVNVPWTDTIVNMTETNPSSSTSYYPVWYTTTTGTITTLHVNNGFVYNTKQGTTSAEGNGDLLLGNSIATGTQGNKSGALWLYSSSSGFGILTQASTGNTGISHVLPTTGGTILNTGTTSFTQSLTSGTTVGKIKINGTETTLYAPTNSDTKNTAGSTNTSSKIFLIGATSQASNPQTYSHDTAYVGTNGSVYSEDMTSSDISTFIGNLEVGGGGTAVDLVVEQGTVNNPSNVPWWYRKWSSGLLEAGCYWTGSVTSYTTLAPLYGFHTYFTFPTTIQPLDTNYQVYADIRVGTGFAIYGGNLNTKTTSNFNMYYLSTGGGTQTAEFWITVRGKWK